MSEIYQIIVGACALLCAIWITRKINVWRTRRAYRGILRELIEKGATTPLSAVALPYASLSIFKAGVRDYRSKVLEFMIGAKIVGKTQEGKFFLRESNQAKRQALFQSER